MATFTWNYYGSTGPAWTDISTNTVNFCGTGGIATPITLNTWNSETHIGGDGTGDVCGANHCRNVKYVSSTQFDSGSGTETIGDGTLAATECTLQIVFTDASSVAITNGRFYTFDGTTTTNEAVGVEAYAVQAQVGSSAWTQVNDDSGNIGGDNSGERLSLADQGAATAHTYYIAVSARPETVGAKTQFDLGIALTYS